MARLKSARGYQGNAMALPVPNLDAALPFYERVMGFRVETRSDSPHRSAVLARDSIRMGLAENGGDPTQDGCAFEVDDVESLLEELKANGLQKDSRGFDVEQHGGASFKVFYVVAPDGLCFWFGQPVARQQR